MRKSVCPKRWGTLIQGQDMYEILRTTLVHDGADSGAGRWTEVSTAEVGPIPL